MQFFKISPIRPFLPRTAGLFLAAFSLLILGLPAVAEETRDQLNIGYFPQWASPNQIGQVDRTFDTQMGIPVHWIPAQTGAEMTAMLQSETIDIAYGQGAVPFVVAIAEGVPLRTVGVAMSYSNYDNCVIHEASGIDTTNIHALIGKKIAVPLYTVPHYKLLRILEHLKVDHTQVEFVDLNSTDGARALKDAEVTMACGFGGGFFEMLKYGNVLMTAEELARIGVFTFDVITIHEDFAQAHPTLVKQFLAITENFNRLYAETPEKFFDVLAGASEQSAENTQAQLDNFIFPNAEEVMHRWFNGNVANFYQGIAQTLQQAGVIQREVADFSTTIDNSFLPLTE